MMINLSSCASFHAFYVIRLHQSIMRLCEIVIRGTNCLFDEYTVPHQCVFSALLRANVQKKQRTVNDSTVVSLYFVVLQPTFSCSTCADFTNVIFITCLVADSYILCHHWQVGEKTLENIYLTNYGRVFTERFGLHRSWTD